MPEAVEVKNFKVDLKETDYHFKKEKIRDSEGKVIGEGKKLPSVKVPVPVPSDEGILEIIQAGGKELQLLRDAVFEIVYTRGRNLLNDIRSKLADGEEIKSEMLDIKQLTWSLIANLPKAERRGLGISDEDWESFAADYRGMMPKVTGKDMDRIEKHVQLFKKRFYPCRNDKKALGVLQDMLNLWATNTSSMEENSDVFEYLKERVDTLMKEEEKILAEAL